jgi:hypothetical protein
MEASAAMRYPSWVVAALFVGSLAAAYAESGDFEKAVDFERKAIVLEAGRSAKKQLEDRLALYKNRKPYREQADR